MAPPKSKGALKAILVLTFIYIVLVFVFGYVFSFVGLLSVIPATLLATVIIYYVGTSEQIAKISGKGEVAVEMAAPHHESAETGAAPKRTRSSASASKQMAAVVSGTERKFCVSCGGKLPPDVKFCPNCGVKQE